MEKLTPEQGKKIIADYLRHQTNDKNTNDDEIIREQGGDTSNEIVVDFENGIYLYKSIDTHITVYNIINTNDLSQSYANEPLNY